MSAVVGERRPARFLLLFLSGLEASMVGALWMLAWMGVNSLLQRRSFWSAENLMATAFQRDAPLGGIGSTFSGLALYLLLYSLLGALFAVAVGNRTPRARLVLLSIVFALLWYYATFRWIWKALLPVVALLHVEQATLLGHLLYGTVMGRYPVYLDRLEAVPPAVLPLPSSEPSEPRPSGSDS